MKPVLVLAAVLGVLGVAAVGYLIVAKIGQVMFRRKKEKSEVE